MSRYNMSLMVLGVGSATLLLSGSARGQEGQFFEGCGVLTLTLEDCLVFVPDDSKLQIPISRIGGWEQFQEDDRIFVTGLFVDCKHLCFLDKCFLEDSILEPCPVIPALSEWGVIVFALLLITAGTIVVGAGKRFRHTTGIYAFLLLCIIGAPTRGEDPAITEKVNSMLAYPHHSEHVLVRFVPGTPQTTRDTLHAAAGAVNRKQGQSPIYYY